MVREADHEGGAPLTALPSAMESRPAPPCAIQLVQPAAAAGRAAAVGSLLSEAVLER